MIIDMKWLMENYPDMIANIEDFDKHVKVHLEHTYRDYDCEYAKINNRPKESANNLTIVLKK